MNDSNLPDLNQHPIPHCHVADKRKPIVAAIVIYDTNEPLPIGTLVPCDSEQTAETILAKARERHCSAQASGQESKTTSMTAMVARVMYGQG